MEGIVFIKFDLNLETCKSIRDRIAKIDSIIDSLLTTALTTVNEGNIAEYELDTGQTRNRVKYNSPESVLDAIDKYETLRNRYALKLQPRMVRLMDEKNFRRR